MIATVKDVAKHAGVSIATVSRVINGKDKVRATTKLKVEQAMKELNYYPNSIAQSFSMQSTKRIALIIDVDNELAFANPFFYQVQFGIEKYLSKRGYSLSIYNQSHIDDKFKMLDKILFERNVDGVIVHSMLLDKKLLTALERSRLPYVVIGEPQSYFDVNWVDIDNTNAGELAAKTMFDDQYRNVLVITNRNSDLFNRQRREGIEQYFSSKKEVVTQTVSFEGKDFEETVLTLIDIFRESKIDSVIALENTHGLAVEWVARELNIKIPDELGIVTFDKYPVVDMSFPKLTTIDIDVLSLGSNAASILLDEIVGESTAKVKLKLSVEIIRRGTTRNLRGDT